MGFLIVILFVLIFLLWNKVVKLEDRIDAIVKRDIQRQKDSQRIEINKEKEKISFQNEDNITKTSEKIPESIVKIGSKKINEKAIQEAIKTPVLKIKDADDIKKAEPEVKPLRPDERTIIRNKQTINTVDQKNDIKITTEQKTYEKNEKKRSDFWKNAEKKFLENWTGILGAVFVVAGTGFLGVYAALKVSPLFRYMMLSITALALYFISYYVNKKEYWKNISLWIRSSGAAIFLFACIGAGGIKALRFIDDPAKALILIVFGIILNLFTAYINKKQIFASTHVLLSVVSLMITVPAASLNPVFMIIIFCVAAIITTIALIPFFYSKWSYHMLISLLSFEVFHIYWYGYLSKPIDDMTNLFAISGFCLIGLTGILSHYSDIYKNEKFNGRTFFDHSILWLITGIGVFIHKLGTPVSSVVLLLLSMATYFNSKRAKEKGISWLFITDSVISQILAVISAFSAYRIGLDENIIMVFLTIEILLFSYIVLLEKNKLLIRISTVFIYLISIVDLLIFYINYKSFNIVSIFLIILSYCIYLFRTRDNDDSYIMDEKISGDLKMSIVGILTGLFPLLLLRYINETNYISVLSVSTIIFLTWFAKKLRRDGMLFSLFFSYGITVFYHYNQSMDKYPAHKLAIDSVLFFLAPFIMLLISKIHKIKSRMINPFIYIQLFSVILFSYKILAFYNIKYLNFSWLLFSLYYLFLSKKDHLLKGKEAISFKISSLYSGYLLIAFFLFRNLLIRPVDIAMFKHLSFNQAIDIFSIIVFMIWYYFKDEFLINNNILDKNLRPLFLELAAITVIYTSLDLSDVIYRPIISIFISFLFINLGKRFDSLSRLCLYSYIPFFISAILNTKRFLLLPHSNIDNEILKDMFLIAVSYISHLTFVIFNRDGKLLSYVKPVYEDKIFLSFCEMMRRLSGILIYSFTIYSIFFSIYFFSTISDLIPSVVLILLAVLYMEYSKYITNKYNNDNTLSGSADEHIMLSSFFLIIAFLLRHFLVDIQSGFYVAGLIQIRTLIEFFSGICMLYIVSFNIPQNKIERPLYKYVFPFSVEILLGFSIAAIYINLDPGWQHLALMAVSFILVALGREKRFSRLRFYSFFTYLASIIHTVFIVSNYVNPSLTMLGQSWVKGVFGIISQLVFLVLIYKNNIFENIFYPDSLSFLSKVDKKMLGFYEYLTFYPLLIGIALFFYYSFSSSILTLMWMLEAFSIFIISIVLVNNHFRYVSMAAVGLCLLRVIFYDLANVDTLARALVFIVSGVILIFMNTVYNKYKGRFENEKK